MTPDDMLALMERFRQAYATGNEAVLLEVTTEDFQWHQHKSQSATDQPTGRVVEGIAGLLAELSWRQTHWSDVRYENLVERAAGDVLLQTFTISGQEDGQPFHANVVDLYPVRDGKIFRKDTYWKYLA